MSTRRAIARYDGVVRTGDCNRYSPKGTAASCQAMSHLLVEPIVDLVSNVLADKSYTPAGM